MQRIEAGQVTVGKCDWGSNGPFSKSRSARRAFSDVSETKRHRSLL